MEATLRITASDLMTYWRPTPCELRVFLHEKGEPEAEPSAFDEVMRRLGIRHEREHLATLGPHLDLSTVPIDERVGRTLDAVCLWNATLYLVEITGGQNFGEGQDGILANDRINWLRTHSND
jgi:hypothetical protein